MVELKGSLSGIGLPAIVQFIGELHHSGSLELSKGTVRAVLGFDDGRLVTADFAGLSGYKALAALSLAFADGEFSLVAGAPTAERSLDLGAKEVQAFLGRAASGEDVGQAAEPPPVESDGASSLGTCPLLGFADDRARHYTRPTALHRCFARGAPSLVTPLEQRDLCLSGQYRTCPRYPTPAPVDVNSTISAVRVAPPSVPEPPVSIAPPQSGDQPAPIEPPPSGVPPAGVTARLAAAGKMHNANASRTTPAPSGTTVPPWTRPPLSARPVTASVRLVRIGVGIGLVLVLAAALFLALTASGWLAGREPSVAGVQTGAELATATSMPVLTVTPVVLPTAAAGTVQEPTSVSTPALVVQPATSIAAVPQSITPGRQPLIDVRFTASGGGWIDNPPFAVWNDGAYRLRASQAARFVAVGAPIDQMLRDVIVSATLHKTGGGPGGGYGLVVRDQGPSPRDGANQLMSAYVLEAGDQGGFGIWRRDGDHWVDIVSWTQSASVRPDESPNDLTVRAVGSRLTFTINGTEVAAVEDSVLAAGGVGVFVGGDFNEVALDHFTVEVPN